MVIVSNLLRKSDRAGALHIGCLGALPLALRASPEVFVTQRRRVV